MSTTEGQHSDAGKKAGVGGADLKLEVIVIPVSDADNAKTSFMVAEQAGKELPS